MTNPIQPDQATVDAVVAWLRNGDEAGAWRMLLTCKDTEPNRNSVDPWETPEVIADAIERGEPFR